MFNVTNFKVGASTPVYASKFVGRAKLELLRKGVGGYGTNSYVFEGTFGSYNLATVKEAMRENEGNTEYRHSSAQSRWQHETGHNAADAHRHGNDYQYNQPRLQSKYEDTTPTETNTKNIINDSKNRETISP